MDKLIIIRDAIFGPGYLNKKSHACPCSYKKGKSKIDGEVGRKIETKIVKDGRKEGFPGRWKGIWNGRCKDCRQEGGDEGINGCVRQGRQEGGKKSGKRR